MIKDPTNIQLCSAFAKIQSNKGKENFNLVQQLDHFVEHQRTFFSI